MFRVNAVPLVNSDIQFPCAADGGRALQVKFALAIRFAFRLVKASSSKRKGVLILDSRRTLASSDRQSSHPILQARDVSQLFLEALHITALFFLDVPHYVSQAGELFPTTIVTLGAWTPITLSSVHFARAQMGVESWQTHECLMTEDALVQSAVPTEVSRALSSYFDAASTVSVIHAAAALAVTTVVAIHTDGQVRRNARTLVVIKRKYIIVNLINRRNT